ncbi:MAG: EAL domain-containing protein [Rhodocyclaceae bacterium]|nr:EAL domain-containing protein [Rhodocyclaceae bacterium]
MNQQTGIEEIDRVAPPKPAGGDNVVRRQASIMLVDDESITLDTLQIFLEDAGYQHFVLTSDAREAIPTLERERPDIVLLDLMMPYVNGFEILEYIRSNERFEHLPVVVLTSSSDAPTRLKALEMGATDFLAKPVDESELVLRVRNTLNAKAYQDRLTYFDRLTGLPNRQMLTDNLEWAIEQSGRLGQSGALLHIDIHRFRRLNEALGPAVADELLQHVARRLASVLHDGSIASVLSQTDSIAELGRLSGDEFSLLVTGNHRPEDLARIARSLLQSMAEPFRLRGQDLYLAINIGIATFPGEDIELNRIQGNAGIAVRSLRTDQPNPEGAFCFYAPELNARAQKRLDLETELRHAIERHELQLYYQPKYDVATETVIGAECLMRWLHPQRGFISPVEFIPLAEETGLILEMGRHVLEEACRQLAEWSSKGLDAGMLAVNVSVQQFRHPGFVEQVRDALSRFGVAASRIKIEVTESLLMTEQEQATRMLNELRALGLHMSIDDFGTGYSSLSYLRTLPIDELKIDRSFLIDVATSSDSAAIVRAILALAHSLDMEVVAEGVETRDQLDFLREHGCDAFQGFLFSKAVPAPEFEAMLAAPASR